MSLKFSGSDGLPHAVMGTWTATSPCATAGRAEISDPVITSLNVSFNYVARGCVGLDTVTFASVLDGKVFLLSADLTVDEDQVGFISWVGSEPAQIAIRGSGGQEKSTVTFRVNGLSSELVRGETIQFRLEGATGGASLLTTSAVSDSDGLVRALVQSGSSPVLLTVVAEHVSSGTSVPSGGLRVATGLAADNHFNIALSIHNPMAFHQINFQQTEVVVAVTDKSGNPVVDGTVVNFVSEEGGSVTSSCVTSRGTCDIQWTPDGRTPPDGRAQVFATVKGTEDFIDINGNKIFDDGDEFPQEFDLGEPYSDNDDNGAYDLGEHFVDSNGNGLRDVGDGLWNGLNCNHSTLCAAVGKFVDLSRQITVYMSDYRNPIICSPDGFAENLSVKVGQVLTLPDFYLSDGNEMAMNIGECANGNPLPAGTEISLEVSGGSLLGASTWTVPSSAVRPNGPYSVSYKAPAEAGTQILTLTIEIPLADSQSENFLIQILP